MAKDVVITVAAQYDASFTNLESDIISKLNSINGKVPKIKIEFDTKSIQSSVNELSRAMATITQASTKGISGQSSAASIKQLTEATNALTDATNKYNTASKTSSSKNDSGNIKANTTAYNQYTKALKEATSMLEKYSAAKNSSSPETQNAYGNIETEIANLKSYYEQLQNGTMSQEQFANSVKESQNAISQAAAQIQTTNDAYNQNAISAKEAAEAQKEIASAAQEAQSGLQAYASAQQSSNEAIQQAYSSYEEAANGMQQLSTAMNEGSIGTDEAREKMSAYQEQLDSAKTTLDGYIQEEEQAAQAAKALAQSQRDGDSAMKSSANAIKNAENMLTRYSAAANSSSQETRSAYKGIEEELERLSSLQKQYANNEIGGTEFKTQVEQSQAQLKAYEQQIISTGDATKSLGDRFSNLASKFTMWFSASQAIMLAIRSIRQLISASIDLDSAMAQLKIVTDETDEAYAQFADDIAKTAQDIGASITDLVDSATTYARLGYNMEESSTLAEYTSMLKNVGDIEVGEAQEAVTSIVKAFDIGVDDIEQVMDKLVAVGNNYPISVSEIAEGMTNTSSTLAAAGNSLEESIALLTAANTTIQNVSRSSTGLRTVVARLRNTKTELDELGEDMTEAKYEELISALTDANVALTDQNGEYRSTYDIMKDIAHEWENLTTTEQAALAQTIAGTRQQAVFYSLVEQFQEAEGAMDTMAESAGTLTDSYDIYMDTTQRHIDTFKAAFQELGSDLFQSDFLSGIVDIGTAIVNIIDKIVELINTIGGLPTVIGAVAGALVLLNFDSITTRITNIINSLKNLPSAISNVASQFTNLGKSASEAARATTEAAEAASYTYAASGETYAYLAGDMAGWSYVTAGEGATIAAEGVATSAGAVAAAIAGVAAAIVATVATIEYLTHSYTRAQKAAEESISTYKDEKTELQSLQAQLSDVNQERQDIIEGAYGRELSLEEEADLVALQSQSEELERQIALRQAVVDEAQAVAEADAAAAMQSSQTFLESLEDEMGGRFKGFFAWLGSGYTTQAYSGYEGTTHNYVQDYVEQGDTSTKGLLESSIKDLGEYQTKLEQVQNDLLKDPTSDYLQGKQQEYLNDIASTYDDINTYSDMLSNQISVLVDDTTGKVKDEYSYLADYIDEAQNLIDSIATLDMSDAERQQYEIGKYFDKNDINGSLSDVFTQAIAEGTDLDEIINELGIDLSDIGDDVDASSLERYFMDTSNSAEAMARKVQASFDQMYSGLRDTLTNWYNDLSAEDQELVYQIILENDTSQWNFAQFQEALDEYRENSKLTFTVDINAETSSLDNLNSAMEASASATGLTSEAIANLTARYQDLDSFDASKLFENTTEGVHLNKEALQELEEEYNNYINNGLQDKLDAEVSKYEEAREKLNSLDEGTADYYATLAEVSSYETQIAETEQLIAQYDGLTSAYNNWQNALSSTNANSEFEKIGSSYDEMEAILNQGWYGNDDLNAYLDLLLSAHQRSGDVVADFEKLTATIDGTNHSLMDYFTYEDGELVTDGLFDFIDDVSAIFGEGYAGIDENGEYYLDLTGDRLDEVAERFGTTAEFIQIMEKAMEEAGFNVHLGDSAISEYEELAEAAQDATDAVEKLAAEKLDLDLDLDLDSTDVENLETQIQDVQSLYDTFLNEDGTMDINAEGYDEVASVLASLIIQKQQVAEAENIILNIDADSCEEGISEVVSLVQDFQEQYDLLELEMAMHADTSDAEESILEIVQELDGMSDEDIQATLHLNDDEMAALRESLDEISESEVVVDADVELDDSALNNIESSIQDYNINVEADTSEAQSEIDSLDGSSSDVNVGVNVDTEQLDEVDSIIASKDGQTINIEVNANCEEAQSEIDSLDSDNIEDKEFDVTANGTQAESTIAQIKSNNIPDKSFTITAIDHASSVINSVKAGIASITDKTVTITENHVTTGSSSSSGGSSARGTANAHGTADAAGDWSVGRSERALMGELGQEMVVRDGKYFTVGDNGAEFVDLRPDDIVFNHFQTEALLNSGYIQGRGLVVGNSFAQGSAYDTATGGRRRTSSSSGSSTSSTTTTKTTTTTTTKSSGSSSSSSSKSTSSSSSSKSSSSSTSSTKSDDFEETMDWIEIKIDRIERAIDSLDLKMSSTYKTWSTRNSALSDELSKIADEITIQQQAYDRYIQQANSVGLSSSYAEKVRNGTIDISTITDEDLKDKIDEYQKWYEKALDCQDAIEELQETEAKLYRTSFDYVQKQYEELLDVIEFNMDMLDEAISQTEEHGYIVSTKYYESLISQEQDNIKQLEKEQAALLDSLNAAISSGSIKTYSEEWYREMPSRPAMAG